MGVFDFLPTFDRCCFCVNLKIGSILIAIWAMLSVCGVAYLAAFPICSTSEEVAQIIMKIARPFIYIGDVVLLISAVIFIIGVLIQKSITAEIFLFGIAFILVTYILYMIAIVITSVLQDECRDFVGLLSLVLSALLWLYFMIIIRSYKEEME